MTQMKRAAVYARYSSDNQRDEFVDAQVRAIEESAKRNSYNVVKVYADKAKSATTDKRLEFQLMIKESALDIFDVLIVHKLDRFSRDKYDSALYKRKLKTHGIKVVSVTGNLDGSPESVILESVIEGMAEYYSKNLAREVMKGMKETAYKCKHTGGKPPLAYDVGSDKKYVINESEAEIVRIIFDLYVNGYGYDKIIKHLNEKGLKTKSGKDFAKNSIYSILSNEKYSGVYVFNRSSKKDAFGKRNNHSSKNNDEIIRIEGGMPAIVSKETFDKAKAMMQVRKKAPAANKAKELYLLSGLIYCGHCGSAMQGNRRQAKDKPKYCSYRCGCRENKKGCDNKEIKKEYVEEFVLSELEKNILNDNAIPILVNKINGHLEKQASNRGSQLESLNKELKEVNNQIDNIVNAIASGLFQQAFKDKMDALEERKSKLEIQIKEIEIKSSYDKITEDQVKNLFSVLKGFVTERNLPECKKFIHDYVHRVNVFQDRVEVVFSVVFDFLKNANEIKMKSEIKKIDLISMYSNSFYFKVSI